MGDVRSAISPGGLYVGESGSVGGNSNTPRSDSVDVGVHVVIVVVVVVVVVDQISNTKTPTLSSHMFRLILRGRRWS